MKLKNGYPVFMGLLVLILFLAGCASPPPPETLAPAPTTPPPRPTDTPTQVVSTPTFTPTACTGWNCTIDGVVYVGEAVPGNELGGVLVKLSQYSNCSPTRGEQQVVTGEDGTFAFEVYLHDTDSFNFKIEVDGYQTGEYSFGGFDCLYCSCPPVEIILQPDK
jgi:hypothetical protein